MATITQCAADILVLENLVLRGWHYLFRFQACLIQEKQDLDCFLDQYYSQLGGWLQQAYITQDAAESGEGGETSHFLQQLHQIQKSLYREVVKLCHPDAARSSPVIQAEAALWLHQAMEAYTAGRGGHLASLRLELLRLSLGDEAYHHALCEQYAMLQQKVRIARDAVYQLRHSAAYRFRQRVLHARNRGFDLLGYVVAQLRQQEIDFPPISTCDG